MEAKEICISLLVIAANMLLTALLRRAARQSGSRGHLSLSFFLELTGTFQICACTHELLLLTEIPPKPHVALALTYVFTALHGWSLPDSFNNPAASVHFFHRGRLGVKELWPQLAGQYIGALLAFLYMNLIWQMGLSSNHSGAAGQGCKNPMQVSVEQAFLLELFFSFLLHLILLHFESASAQSKVHLVALVITTFVFAGGHLTGSIMNPSLAFSLHLKCFMDNFWNYVLVYWIAPCVGSSLAVVLWFDLLPLIR